MTTVPEAPVRLMAVPDKIAGPLTITNSTGRLLEAVALSVKLPLELNRSMGAAQVIVCASFSPVIADEVLEELLEPTLLVAVTVNV